MEISICSVNYRSGHLLRFNQQLTHRLNIGTNSRWIIVENTPEGEPCVFSLDKANSSTVVLPSVVTKYLPPISGSYLHGLGLNAALSKAETRFVLLLDPDFFIVRPNWIQAVVSHMKQEKLSFWGAPYCPARWIKYRYFPSAVCMMIDTQSLDKAVLDFTPSLGERSKIRLRIEKHWPRSGIGQSPDVGHRIYRKYKRAPYGYLQPINEEVFTAIRNRRLKWLPDRWSFVPTRKNYVLSSFSSVERLSIEMARLMEVFVFEGEIFGVHLRSRLQPHINLEDVLEEIENLAKRGGQPFTLKENETHD